MKRTSTAICFTALSLALGVAASAGATLIGNGSFETPEVQGTWQQFYSIDDWYNDTWFGNPRLELQENGLYGSALTAAHGDQWIELGSSNPTFISQTFDTQVGQQLTLKFAFSARPGTSAAENQLWVAVGGRGAEQLFSDVLTTDTVGWQYYTYSFTANSTEMKLALGDARGLPGFTGPGGRPSYGTLVDDVSVPEPGTMLLFGTGLLGLVGIARRKGDS